MSRPAAPSAPAKTTPGNTPAKGQESDLVGARLPKWAPYGSAVAGWGLAIGLKFLLGWTGWYTTFFSGAALFIIIYTAWSFNVEGRRRAKDRFATTLIYTSFVCAIVPLVLILGYIAVKGLPLFSPDFFLKSMNGVTSRQEGGGIYAALIGTLIIVGIATVIALPIGIFTAIYLVEYGRGKFARTVTFFVDVMTGVPSIVAGLFVYTFLVARVRDAALRGGRRDRAGNPDGPGVGARVGGDAQARTA